ncbi:MAG: hypothetical protein Q4F31_10800 [Eubacteriales bacterium]|nr:hypothetical protein [Eubacteriales bacterium]
MKKLLSFITVLALLLSLGAAALAEVIVDGQTITESAPAGNVEITVTDNQVTASGNPGYVSADAKPAGPDSLTVIGDVIGYTNDHSVKASHGAKITVQDNPDTPEQEGNVTSGEGQNAVHAEQNSQISVEGNATANGYHANAVYVHAGENAVVTIGGNATAEGYDGTAVEVAGNSTNAVVTVKGNATALSEGTGVHVNGSGASVTVVGNAVADGNNSKAVNSSNNSAVTVGGNAVAGDGGYAVVSLEGSTVIVEGGAIGQLMNLDPSFAEFTSGEIYIGQLSGSITEASDKEKIHYLIGLEDGSDILSKPISLEDAGNIINTNSVEGVEKDGVKKTYISTSTSDASTLNGKTVTLKPKSGYTDLDVSGIDAANVTLDKNPDGSVSLTFGSNFTGGLQSLIIILNKIAQDNPDVVADIIVNADVIASVFVDSSFAVTTISVELPENAVEGAVTALDIPNHAGIKVAPSLLSKTAEYHLVQLFLDDNPVPENAYSITNHGDGSVTIQMSNTYLLSLGSGTFNFRVLVDGQEIFFTVLVAK